MPRLLLAPVMCVYVGRVARVSVCVRALVAASVCSHVSVNRVVARGGLAAPPVRGLFARAVYSLCRTRGERKQKVHLIK